MDQTQHNRNEKDQGQSLAEFALILPVLLVLFMGIVDFGRVLMTYAQQSASVRNALRYGVIIGYSESGAAGRPNYTNCDEMEKIARTVFFANVTNVTVEFIKPDMSTVACNQSDPLLDSKLANGDILHIRVEADVDMVTPFFPDSLPLVIEGRRTLVKDITLAAVGGSGGGDDDSGDDSGDDDSGGITITEDTTVAPLPEGSGTLCHAAKANRYIGLTWTAATDPNVEGFHIYAKTPAAAQWTLIGDIADPSATACSGSLAACWTLAASNPTVAQLWNDNMQNLVYRVAAYGDGGAAEGTSANQITIECVFRAENVQISPEDSGTNCVGSSPYFVGLQWDVTSNAEGYFIYANKGSGTVRVGQVTSGSIPQCGYSISGVTNVGGVDIPGCYNIKSAEWKDNKATTFMVVPYTTGGSIFYFEEAQVVGPFTCRP